MILLGMSLGMPLGCTTSPSPLFSPCSVSGTISPLLHDVRFSFSMMPNISIINSLKIFIPVYSFCLPAPSVRHPNEYKTKVWEPIATAPPPG